MSQSPGPDQLAGLVREAARSVFFTMLGLPLTDKPSYEAPTEPADACDGVEALVGIGGSWTGTGRICCSSKFACTMAGALLMTTCEALDEEVLDAVGELANIVIGNIKTGLEEQLGPLGLSIPTVIFGRNYRTRSAGVTSWLVVPFESNEELWEVRFCLVQPRTVSRAHIPMSHRVEALRPQPKF